VFLAGCIGGQIFRDSKTALKTDYPSVDYKGEALEAANLPFYLSDKTPATHKISLYCTEHHQASSIAYAYQVDKFYI